MGKQTFTPSYLRRNLILHLILTPVTAGAWWVIALPYWLNVKLSRRLVIDEGYVRYQTGLLSKNMREIKTSDVRSMKIKQGAVSRLLGIGDIEISSASGIDDQIIVRGISRPERIRSLLKSSRS